MPRFTSHAAAVLALLPALTLNFGQGYAGTAVGRPAVQVSSVWRLADTQHFGQVGNASGFSVILSAGRQVWVFGGTNPGGQSSPIALTRVGKHWRVSSMPAGLTSFISDASAAAADDIWAVSSYGRYVLHWNGQHWQVARRWREPGVITDVVAVSPRDAWVFGTSATGTRSIGTWHYVGTRWIETRGIGREIYRASVASGRDIWAIAAGPSGDVIVHLADRRWRIVPAGRAIARIRWHDILAESAADVWLAGDAVGRGGVGRLVLAHWNGTRWAMFDTSVQAWAGQLAAVGSGQVALTASSAGILAAGLIVQVTEGGRVTWSTIASNFGSGVSDVVFASRAGVLWASGGILTRLGGDGAIWVTAPRHAGRPVDADRE